MRRLSKDEILLLSTVVGSAAFIISLRNQLPELRNECIRDSHYCWLFTAENILSSMITAVKTAITTAIASYGAGYLFKTHQATENVHTQNNEIVPNAPGGPKK